MEEKQPIIIKKINKGHGHHGGAWKVAFADFVTAMMAFFMLMWLMGSTTKEERAAISDYFQNPSAVQGTSTSVTRNPGINGPGGASTSLVKLGGALDLKKGEGKKLKEDKPSEEEARKIAQEQEKKQLEDLMDELKTAIDKSEALASFKDQLLIDITSEGLRIQIVDKEGRPMFDSGSTSLKDYSAKILGEISKIINQVPNRISITGHTDGKPYQNRLGYSNWELSSERANAARRALLGGGMQDDKIGRVVGLAASVLFDQQNPLNPTNRRISIIVMNKETEAAIQSGEKSAAPVPAAAAETAPQPAATKPAQTAAPALPATTPDIHAAPAQHATAH
jgi:chemotaxis protein MotB